MSKTAVGARELKTRLGTYLRRVQEGHSLIVTERGRPVAELRPVQVEDSSEEARLEELIALGEVTRESKAPLAPFRPVAIEGKALSATIIEDRDDRF